MIIRFVIKAVCFLTESTCSVIIALSSNPFCDNDRDLITNTNNKNNRRDRGEINNNSNKDKVPSSVMSRTLSYTVLCYVHMATIGFLTVSRWIYPRAKVSCLGKVLVVAVVVVG